MGKSKTKSRDISIANNKSITFPTVSGKAKHDLLIVGNFNGILGEIHVNPNGQYDFDVPEENEIFVWQNNLWAVVNTIQSAHKVILISSRETITYFNHVLSIMRDNGCFDKVGRSNAIRTYFRAWCVETDNEYYEKVKQFEGAGMKFDTIIQNPPYKGSLHLDFFEKGLNLLSEKGKMVIVEPATWLINVRRNGKASRYDEIKKKIEGHVESVVIENLNNEFGTALQAPFATTTIDMSNTFAMIDFKCFGEHRTVSSLYDCNMVGDYDVIQSILAKCQNFGDMMKNHVTNKKFDGDYWYTKYAEIISGGSIGCSLTSNAVCMSYDSNDIWRDGYLRGYKTPLFHLNANEILQTPICKIDNGNKITNKIANNIYGMKQELENWKHFVFSNKLPLFLNIVLTIDQHNNSKEFVPWLVDKQYTNDEINKLFGFTEEEIKLMDMTLKKYERNSPWFRRYMCGKDSATDDEVNEFIKRISE